MTPDSRAASVRRIAFSRNYLGVHTPQDVLVGMLSGLLVMWGTFKLLKWLDEHPEKDITVMCSGILVAVLVAVFAALKQYPADYDAAGNPLVDGAKMAIDTYKGAGYGSYRAERNDHFALRHFGSPRSFEVALLYQIWAEYSNRVGTRSWQNDCAKGEGQYNNNQQKFICEHDIRAAQGFFPKCGGKTFGASVCLPYQLKKL